MNGISRPHPAQVPTLTEVIDVQGQRPAATGEGASGGERGTVPGLGPAVMPLQGIRPSLPLDALPVLGEVVSQPSGQPLPSPAQPSPAQPSPAVASPPQLAQPVPSEAQLAQRVLADVQRQVDGMLEFRLKEAMAPLLARHTEAIARDLRDELTRTLKDVVARSVAQELAKLRQR